MEITIQPQNNSLSYLIDPTFTKVNRLFVLSFERNAKGYCRDSFSHYYVPNVKIKYFNVLIDEKGFFVYSRNNFPEKNKGWAYVINHDEYANVGTHWIALFCKKREIVYFNSFGVEHVSKEIKEFIGHKSIKANIFQVQANNLIMCEYFCIAFIDFMIAGKKLTHFTSMFSPRDLTI